MKNDPDSGHEVNYDISVNTNEFDLLTRYVDNEGNKCETTFNYLNGQNKTTQIGDHKSFNTYDKNNNLRGPRTNCVKL